MPDSLPVRREQPKRGRAGCSPALLLRGAASAGAAECLTWERNECLGHAALCTLLLLRRDPRDVSLLPCYLIYPLGSCCYFCLLQL